MDLGINGAVELDRVLPPDTKRHVLAMREWHLQTGPSAFLKENLDRLVGYNNVGTIGLELSPYMMVMNWAYQDGKLGETKRDNREALVAAYQAAGNPAYASNLRESGLMAASALDRHIRVITYDSRAGTLFTEELKRQQNPIAQVDRSLRANPNLHAADLQLQSTTPGLAEHTKLLLQIRELLQYYPHYRQKLASIEANIIAMRKQKIPADIISATIVTQLADSNRNLVTKIGEAHQAGLADNTAFGDYQGIFAHGLAKAGWHVTDAFIASSAEVQNAISTAAGSMQDCHAYGHIDFIYAADTDTVAKPPAGSWLPDWALKLIASPPLGIVRDVISCTASPNAETLYTPPQLNPTMVASLRRYNTEMRAANAPLARPPYTAVRQR